MEKKDLKIVTAIVIGFALLLGSNIIPGVNTYPVLASLWGAACAFSWYGVNHLFGKKE